MTARCPDCGASLSDEPWAARLCLSCLGELALADTSLAAELEAAPSERPTQQYSAETFAPGQILGNRFRIRSLLGRGGMGEVWRALDLKLRVDVALKALRPSLLASERAVETLRQEVRAARDVVSPNVCRVFDLVELEGRELVSMEYVDGTTLLAILAARGPLALDEAQEIASQFLAGLEAIHAAGLVHRDIKPENVMVTRAGRVVVMDFGIAKAWSEGGGVRTVSGTPAYMAPEQARGEPLDARADVFSAAVVLAEMVAPGGLSEAGARERIWQRIHAGPPRLDDTPWATVLAKAVAGYKEQRYPSAVALARALEEVTLRVAGAERLEPYPGLAAFTEQDAAYFFGRELELEAMWRKLGRRSHLLALIGPSGAGKSSFLRAGLMASLPAGWRAVLATPGDRPLAALAQALVPELAGDTEGLQILVRAEKPDTAVAAFTRWRQGHEQALLIVDQFEELFTQNPPEIQGRFVETLARLALEADLHVLLSLRDDFLFQCHAHEALRPILSELTLLGPPIGIALRRAMVQPALKCGYRFEDEALVDAMLAEVEGERGALPLLAFAAARLWERRDRERGLLTREAFTSIGGVGGALAQHAEATLERIGQDRLPIVRELFRNLATAQGTRATLDREELLSVFAGGRVGEATEPVPSRRAGAEEVLDALIDARLLTSYELPAAEGESAGHHRIEVIHESLLTAWPRLVRWRTQDEDGALLRDQLRQVARLWEERGQPEDLLWTGTSFREYQLWRERYGGNLSAGEETFARAMTARAMRRRKRKRLAVAASFALLLTVLGVVAGFWRQSYAERRRAQSEALRAEASKLLALGQAQLDASPTAALAYATKSLELADTREGRLFALRALQRGPTGLPVVVPPEEGDAIFAVTAAFSPDAEWLAIGGVRKAQLRRRDGSDPLVLGDYPTGSGAFVQVGFSPNGDRLITNSDGDLRIWAVPEGRQLWQGKAEEGPSWLDVRGDGFFTWTVFGDPAGSNVSARWWPLGGGASRHIGNREIWYADLDATATRLAYSATGREIYLQRLGAWNSSPRMLASQQSEIRVLKFAADGERLAVLDAEEIRIWPLEESASAVRPERILPSGGSNRLAVAPQGNWLAAGGIEDGEPTVRLWDLAAPLGAEPLLLNKPDAGVPILGEMTFDPTGQWLVTTNGRRAIFWPLQRRYAWVLRGHSFPVGGLAFTPDGRALVSASADGSVRLWPLSGEGWKSRVILEGAGELWALDIDRSGERIAVGGVQGKVAVLSLDGGPSQELAGYSSKVDIWEVAFSPDGGRVAAAALRGPPEDKVVRVWDLASGEAQVLGSVQGAGEDYQGSVAFLEFLGEDRLLSAGEASALSLWDLRRGTVEVLQEGRFGGMAADERGRFLLASRLLSAEIEGRMARSELVLRSLEGSEVRTLPSHGTHPTLLDLDSAAGVVASGSEDGLVRVGPLSGEEPHVLFAHGGKVLRVAISPDGRWIASGGWDGLIRLWPMPDLSQPPFHTLPHDHLLARLHALTTVRVVEDPDSPTGWTLDTGPFPGWETVPTW